MTRETFSRTHFSAFVGGMLASAVCKDVMGTDLPLWARLLINLSVVLAAGAIASMKPRSAGT
jgi:hypothetical protein